VSRDRIALVNALWRIALLLLVGYSTASARPLGYQQDDSGQATAQVFRVGSSSSSDDPLTNGSELNIDDDDDDDVVLVAPRRPARARVRPAGVTGEATSVVVGANHTPPFRPPR
jgi:hypothetical protein